MMKPIFTTVLLLVFIAGTVSAQSIDELNSRRIKEQEKARLYNYSSTHKKTIDWDVDDDTWGLAYSYSPHFPLSLSVNYTTSYFSIIGEIGVACTNKKYEINEGKKDMPILYLMASPGFYIKYFSINYGVGYLFNVQDYPSLTINNVPQEYDKTVSGNFCHKPSITGYIPINDGDNYIILNAGYIFLPKFKDLEGFSCGIGIQWTL